MNNPGGVPEWSKEFKVEFTFNTATLTYTFKYPNTLDVSGPWISNPPQVYINSDKVGMVSSDFPDNAACLGNGEYNCDLTISYSVTSSIKQGKNTFIMESIDWPGWTDKDDFVFTNARIVFD